MDFEIHQNLGSFLGIAKIGGTGHPFAHEPNSKILEKNAQVRSPDLGVFLFELINNRNRTDRGNQVSRRIVRSDRQRIYRSVVAGLVVVFASVS